MVDARTTPPHLQPLVLILLGLLALFFIAAVPVARSLLAGTEPPALVAPIAHWTWSARWRMFTELRPNHEDVEVTADGEPVDLAVIYPTHWNEGPGYTRDDFLRSARAVGVLSADICSRTGAQRLRWTYLAWPKTIGGPQVKDDVQRRALWDVPCGGQPVRLGTVGTSGKFR